ncbi:MAG: tRNA (guanosine(37)-N1)-methyltransferase TrmD [Terriglobales bacterium]
MQFDLLTIFPDFFHGPLEFGVVARARQSGLLKVNLHQLRDFTRDLHRTTDDRPFGGGEGMVMKAEPIWECLQHVTGAAARVQRHLIQPAPTRVILLSAQGPLFRQADAWRLAAYQQIVLICGRYEGVDERVAEHMADEELSIGSYVLSGGELAAAIVLDAVARLIPGVLGHEESCRNESFGGGAASSEPDEPPLPGILDCPHYTRPVEFQGWEVPEALRGGHHAVIRRWRLKEALRKTRRHRPDLLPEGMPAAWQSLLREIEREAGPPSEDESLP